MGSRLPNWDSLCSSHYGDTAICERGSAQPWNDFIERNEKVSEHCLRDLPGVEQPFMTMWIASKNIKMHVIDILTFNARNIKQQQLRKVSFDPEVYFGEVKREHGLDFFVDKVKKISVKEIEENGRETFEILSSIVGNVQGLTARMDAIPYICDLTSDDVEQLSSSSDPDVANCIALLAFLASEVSMILEGEDALKIRRPSGDLMGDFTVSVINQLRAWEIEELNNLLIVTPYGTSHTCRLDRNASLLMYPDHVKLNILVIGDGIEVGAGLSKVASPINSIK